MGIATDDSERKTSVAVPVRLDLTPHIAVEAEVAHWGSEQTFQSGPGLLTGLSNSPFGQYASSTTSYTKATWLAIVNLLAHSRGRLAVFGGGGIGVGSSRSLHRRQAIGLEIPSTG